MLVMVLKFKSKCRTTVVVTIKEHIKRPKMEPRIRKERVSDVWVIVKLNEVLLSAIKLQLQNAHTWVDCIQRSSLLIQPHGC